MTVAGFRKSTIAALGAASLVALTSCAQIPASEEVSTCTPASEFHVERTGEGEGPVITENAIAAFEFSVTLEDGSEFIPTTPVYDAGDGSSAPINLNYLSQFPIAAFGGMAADLSSVGEALRCAQAGQQVNATLRIDQLFAEDITASMTEEVLSQEVTLVANVDSVFHSAATGRIALQQSGIPAVVTAPDGTPGVTIPQQPAPTELRQAVTINGFGADVEEGQTLTLHLSAFTWTDSTQVLTTWGNAGPALQLQAGAGDGLYDITTQLVGKSVGSQVVIVVPASTIAESSESSIASLASDDAVVFVVDILGAD